MDLNTEHELHARRRGRNMGVMLLLVLFVAMIFGLTLVKVTKLGEQGVDDMGLRNRLDPPLQSVPDPDFQPESGNDG